VVSSVSSANLRPTQGSSSKVPEKVTPFMKAITRKPLNSTSGYSLFKSSSSTIKVISKAQSPVVPSTACVLPPAYRLSATIKLPASKKTRLFTFSTKPPKKILEGRLEAMPARPVPLVVNSTSRPVKEVKKAIVSKLVGFKMEKSNAKKDRKPAETGGRTFAGWKK
jgi:hypothetical protein